MTTFARTAGGDVDRHLPAPGRPVPTASYRLQLHAGFSFADAADAVPYLADLGVSHVYCSPYLEAAPGSTHGYDVVDHSRLNPELGGKPGFERLRAACLAEGLGLVLDLVPNHMAVAPEARNRAWWSVLREGRFSPYAAWFDVDWDSPDNPGKVLLPVLGSALSECVEKDEVRLSDDGERVVYFDHEAPVAPGTLVLGDVLATLEAQHYRLCQWRVATEELNYRRFFDVTKLAGLRVEDPEVFSATHRLVLAQVRDGVLDGLRIDHPDGLADPEGYLWRLRHETGGVWTVVEKILEPAESLPGSWPVAGTTGYDVLNRLTRLFVDPAAMEPLSRLYGELSGAATDYAEVATASKEHVLREILAPEVDRLAGLLLAEARRRRLDLTRRSLCEAVVAVLGAFDVYRAYVGAGRRPTLEARSTVVRACSRARQRVPHRSSEIDLVEELALSGPPGFVTRFQQTCGPVMAKGIEDTAFYRYARFLPLNEVGGAPGVFPDDYPRTAVEEFHGAAATTQRDWPLSMTTLSTHDTKRSEDVRARLAVLSEDPRGWAQVATTLLALGDRHADQENGWPDRGTLYLLLQTLVGAWPLPVERARAYAEKVSREAKLHTSWTDPVPDYDAALATWVHSVYEDRAFVAALEDYAATLVELGRVNSLAQKLLQLTMPGVPDIYQGQEVWDASLVDPDNRRPVDLAARRNLLVGLEDGPPPAVDDGGAAKLLVVSRALRLRREHPEWFGTEATYEALWAAGSAADHVVAFARSGAAVTVVPRLVLGLRRGGGWRDTTLTLPTGRWTCILTGRRHDGGTSYVLRLLRDFPVALLVRTG